jgi:two-component system sensor histidine kinase/response regulator
MANDQQPDDLAGVKSQFLAHMSREIQQSMKDIMAHADLMKKTDLSARQSEHIEAIVISAGHLSWVVNDILDFSQLESGEIQLQCIEFNLEYLINDVLKKAAEKRSNPAVELYVDIAQDVPCHLEGDPTRLRQVLVNLLSNAFKFTSQGRVGILVCHQTDAGSAGKVHLRIVVKDTGKGIAADRLKSIFDPRVQDGAIISWEHGGMGLGLKVCGLIVDAMGGKITADSREGRGSKFVVELTFKEAASVSRKRMYPLTREELVGKRAIIVDDNEIARKILNKCCETMGIKVLLMSASPKAVLHMLHDLSEDGEDPDLVLCDIMMPEMDGYELARRIRANGRFKDIKMVAVTSAMRVGEARNAQKSGFNGFLPKPVFLDELAKIIGAVLGDRREGGAIITRHMAEEIGLEKVDILVVESRVSGRALLEECLEALGCTSKIVTNSVDAVEGLKVKRYDICLVDYDALQDSEEETRMIKAAGGPMPVVALVTEETKQDRADLLRTGADDFLVKPVDMVSLKKIVTRYRKN